MRRSRSMFRSLVVATVVGASALSLSFSAAEGVAQAAPQGNETEARARYSRGVELYNEGAYTAALVELERAQALAPHYGILHSIGLVKVQLADFVGALSAFEEYLAAGGDEVSPQRKAEVKDKVQQLRERVGSIEVTVNAEGAEVVLDENVVGTSPLTKPILVNPGKHELSARRPGEKGEVKKLTVAGSDKVKVSFDMTGKVAATSVSSNANVNLGPPKWVWGTWIAAGAFTVGAITTGILALKSASDLKDQRENAPASGSNLDDLSSKAKTLGLVTDILGGAAIVLGGVSLYFTLAPRTASPSTEPTPAPKPATAAIAAKPPELRLGAGRLALVGEF